MITRFEGGSVGNGFRAAPVLQTAGVVPWRKSPPSSHNLWTCPTGIWLGLTFCARITTTHGRSWT